MKIKQRKFILFIVPLLVSSAMADQIDFFVSGGASLLHQSDSTVQIDTISANRYSPEKTWVPNALLGVGFGNTYRDIDQKHFNVSINFAAYGIRFGTLKGTEYPAANLGNFDTLDYQFRARSVALFF